MRWVSFLLGGGGGEGKGRGDVEVWNRTALVFVVSVRTVESRPWRFTSSKETMRVGAGGLGTGNLRRLVVQ